MASRSTDQPMGAEVDVDNILTYSVGPPRRFFSEHFTTLGAQFTIWAYPQPAQVLRLITSSIFVACGVKLDYDYVQHFRDDHGRDYFYYRPPPFRRKTRIHATSADPVKFAEAYADAKQRHESRDEFEQFKTRHPIGTKARLALDLLLYTGQRGSDVVLRGKQHVRDGWLRLTQQENRNRRPVSLQLPILPILQATIDAPPATRCSL